MISLAGKNLEELEKIIVDLGEQKFRAKQLYAWLYKKSAASFDEMTNLSKDFRETLKQNTIISPITIKKKQVSKDGTIKYLLELEDGHTVETVLMRFDNRPNLSACVSTQVGCAVKCLFCATGQRGFIRNLKAYEIVEQILTIQRDTKLEVTNVVYMGQGEPLYNFDEVMKSVNIINTELEIGNRRITLSTSGVIPAINKLAKENRQLTLAFSMHAPNIELRQKLVPTEKKYPLPDIIKALRNLTEKTGRRVTIEYVMIDGMNDTIELAKEMNNVLKGLNCNINLIPYNSASEHDLQPPSMHTINKFKFILEQSGRKVTVRLKRGDDIKAACGQLSGN
ncbi:MAG: 23S rRNA (adenine(2503)-C(2))-methyltransferase RlmN [bacterium]